MQSNTLADPVSVQLTLKLANLAPSSSESFIFKVHRQLRGINEKAYEPEIVAIGPYHDGKQKNLCMMEEHKLRYLKEMLQRKGENNADRYIVVVRSLEAGARRCYAEPIDHTTDEFVKMLLLDSCFVVEVIRKFAMANLRSNKDPIFEMNWILTSLQRDLLLFENQIPFSILCSIFDLIERPNHNRFMYLASSFFGDLSPGNGYQKQQVNPNVAPNIKHLLGLIHNNWLPANHVRTQTQTTSQCFIPSATELLEAGVKIKKANEVSNLFDITFSNGTIRIPRLTIEDRTETFLRNLVAYEEYSSDSQPKYITDYVRFIDCLINSSKDVELLCRRGIIDNWLSDKEAVSDILNKISNAVAGPGSNFCYAEIFNNLNYHCSQPLNKWLANLRRVYFNGPWSIISFFAASLLIGLAIVQTTFTVSPRK